ncbi:hypothetical protein ACIP6V_35200 [Streptomyces sp. NPDC088770]|uniref:hypothetical protein n=1 Tax=unclassified Streptomyces TaxID=2593676 RepID=UPI0038229F12
MVTPALLDHSRQARAAEGFDKSAFSINWKARQARCPAGRTSSNWNPVQTTTSRPAPRVIRPRLDADDADDRSAAPA